MPAGIHKITVEQGTTYNQTFIWRINSNPVDLTGYTARMQVRTPNKRIGHLQTDYRNMPLILTLTSQNGDIALNGATGRITVSIPPATTKNLPGGTYEYDLEMVASPTNITRLLRGVFVVDPEVTTI